MKTYIWETKSDTCNCNPENPRHLSPKGILDQRYSQMCMWNLLYKNSSKIRYKWIFKIFYCYSITVVCLFSPSFHPTPAKPTSRPHPHPPPWFCPCVLHSSSCNPLSSLSSPHSPLAIVRLFLISMSLVIFCLVFSSVDYVPVKSEIIWYLSLTVWLISLNIMLSSSIHAVAKGISSFFLSAA